MNKTQFSGLNSFTHTCNLYQDTAKLDCVFFLNVNYIKSQTGAAETGKLFRQQFYNLILQ